MRVLAFLFGEAWKSQIGLFSEGAMRSVAAATTGKHSTQGGQPKAGGQLGLFDFAPKPSDPTHGGKLHPEERTDTQGHTQTRWVAQPEPETAPRAAAQDEPEPKPPTGPALVFDTPARPAKRKAAPPGSRMAHKIEAGEHTWGSRKDLATPSTSSDLEAFSNAEAFKLVTKDALFTPMDVQQARADGKTPGYVLLRHTLEKAVASRPQDTPEARAAYMDGIDFFRKSMDACQSAADLHDFTLEWKQLSGGRWRLPAEYLTEEAARDAIRSALPGAGNYRINHESDVQQVASGKWRAYPYEKTKDGNNAYSRMSQALGKNLDAIVLYAGNEGWFSNGRNGWKPHNEVLLVARKLEKLRLGWEDPRVMEAIEAATGKKTAGPRAGAKEGDEAVAWGAFAQKKVAGTSRRVGGRQVEHTSSAKMVEMFNLKNVQFGGWVSDDDAREHVKSSTAALSDLADIIGIAPATVSLHGRLTLGLGARGKGGAASAHYEGATKAINLTKWAGGGSLAHEWGHALDNIMAEMGSDGGADKFVSDHQHTSQSYPSGPLAKMNQTVRNAFGGVMEAILGSGKHARRNGPANTAKVAELNDLAKRMGNGNVRDGSMTPEYRAAHQDFLKWRTDNDHHLQHSVYFHDSDAFNGKSGRGKDPSQKGGYWTRSHELFARAFESYVQDRLEGNGRENTYLVNGTKGGGKRGSMVTGRFRNAEAEKRGEHAWPYPQGDERKAINTEFDNLFKVLRDTGEIHKAFNGVLPVTRILTKRSRRSIYVFTFGAEAAKAKAKSDTATMDMFGGGGPSGDPTHGGKLHAEKRTDKSGHQSTRYVLGTEAAGGGALHPGGHTEIPQSKAGQAGAAPAAKPPIKPASKEFLDSLRPAPAPTRPSQKHHAAQVEHQDAQQHHYAAATAAEDAGDDHLADFHHAAARAHGEANSAQGRAGAQAPKGGELYDLAAGTAQTMSKKAKQASAHATKAAKTSAAKQAAHHGGGGSDGKGGGNLRAEAHRHSEERHTAQAAKARSMGHDEVARWHDHAASSHEAAAQAQGDNRQDADTLSERAGRATGNAMSKAASVAAMASGAHERDVAPWNVSQVSPEQQEEHAASITEAMSHESKAEMEKGRPAEAIHRAHAADARYRAARVRNDGHGMTKHREDLQTWTSQARDLAQEDPNHGVDGYTPAALASAHNRAAAKARRNSPEQHAHQTAARAWDRHWGDDWQGVSDHHYAALTSKGGMRGKIATTAELMAKHHAAPGDLAGKASQEAISKAATKGPERANPPQSVRLNRFGTKTDHPVVHSEGRYHVIEHPPTESTKGRMKHYPGHYAVVERQEPDGSHHNPVGHLTKHEAVGLAASLHGSHPDGWDAIRANARAVAPAVGTSDDQHYEGIAKMGGYLAQQDRAKSASAGRVPKPVVR